jgi:iron complex outermembrane receptor protein
VVTGERTDLPLVPQADFTAFATVLDTSDAPRELTTLADVLSESVGVQVRRFGGLGAFSTLSVRGFSPGQVQIYFDGVPLTRADNETVNLGDLPLDAVDRVEIYRGMTPLGFPQSGPGGVVNIVTRAPGKTPLTAASVSYGSFDTRKATAAYGAAQDGWEYLALASYLGSEGNFTFTDDRGTTDNPADDREVERVNNDFDAGTLTARVRRRVSERLTLSLMSDTFAKDEGVPGRDAPQSEGARRELFRQLASFGADLRLDTRIPVDLDGSAYFVYRREAFTVPFPDPAFQVPRDEVAESLSVGGQVLARTLVGRHHAPGAVLALSNEFFVDRDDVGVARVAQPGDGPTRSRLHLALGADDELTLLAGRVLVVPSLRGEWFQDDFPPDDRLADPVSVSGTETRSFVAPRLGVRAVVWSGVDLLGNVGRWERVPNLRELFGTAGLVVGNPDLKPERTFNWDVGLQARLPDVGPLAGAYVEYAYFENDIDDVIVLDTSSSLLLFRAINVSSAHVTGHEVSGRARLAELVHLSGNYTFQDARDDSDGALADFSGNQLPGRPEHEAYGQVQVQWLRDGRVPGVDAAHVSFDVNFLAGNFLDRANVQRVDSRLLYGAGLSFDLRGDVRLAVQVLNLGDEQTRDVADFPLPGRSVFGTVSWGFGGGSGAPAAHRP